MTDSNETKTAAPSALPDSKHAATNTKEPAPFHFHHVSVDVLPAIRHNIAQILHNRRFGLVDRSLWPATAAAECEDLAMVAQHEETQEYLYVYFVQKDPKVSVGRMRNYVKHLQNQDPPVLRFWVVYAQARTTGAYRTIVPANMKVEFWEVSKLFPDVAHHSLQPKARKLTLDEEQELLKRLNITSKTMLPRFDPDDAFVRVKGWEVGDVIELIRQFGDQQEPQVYYRHVSTS